MPFLFCFLQENTKVFCSLRLDKCRFWKKYQSHDAKSCVAKALKLRTQLLLQMLIDFVVPEGQTSLIPRKIQTSSETETQTVLPTLDTTTPRSFSDGFFLLDEQWTKLKLDEIVHEQEHCSVFHVWFKSIHVDLRFHAKPFSSCVYLSSDEATKTIQRTSMAKTPKKHHTFDHKPVTKLSFPRISSPGLCLGRHCFADVHKVCGTMSAPQRSVKSESNSVRK